MDLVLEKFLMSLLPITSCPQTNLHLQNKKAPYAKLYTEQGHKIHTTCFFSSVKHSWNEINQIINEQKNSQE